MSFGSDSIQGAASTVGVTTETAATYDFVANSIPDNTSAIVVLRAIGFDSSQNTVTIEKQYGVKRDSGDCSIVGLPTTTIAAADLALVTADANLVINGTAIEGEVTGVLLNTIGWGVRLDIFYHNDV